MFSTSDSTTEKSADWGAYVLVVVSLSLLLSIVMEDTNSCSLGVIGFDRNFVMIPDLFVSVFVIDQCFGFTPAICPVSLFWK